MDLKIVNLTKIDREKDSATQKLQILLIIFFPNSLSQSDNPCQCNFLVNETIDEFTNFNNFSQPDILIIR